MCVSMSGFLCISSFGIDGVLVHILGAVSSSLLRFSVGLHKLARSRWPGIWVGADAGWN